MRGGELWLIFEYKYDEECKQARQKYWKESVSLRYIYIYMICMWQLEDKNKGKTCVFSKQNPKIVLHPCHCELYPETRELDLESCPLYEEVEREVVAVVEAVAAS